MSDSKHEWHPYAKLFPILSGEHIEALAEDIRQNGLKQPIIIDSHERIIDGRNRSAACQLAGVEPVYEPFVGSDAEILKLVVSLNLHRRHLDESQRNAIASEIANLKHGRPEEKGPIGPFVDDVPHVSAAQAAQMMNGSERGVKRANRVKREGIPEVFEAVKAGDLNLARAEKIALLPHEEQPEALEKALNNVPTPSPAKPTTKPPVDNGNSEPPTKGIGIRQSNAAIDCLMKIPKSDPQREAGLKAVAKWIRVHM